MRRKTCSSLLSQLSSFMLAGCESHQAKVDALQKEYDQLDAAISPRTAPAEYLKVPPTLSPK